VTDAATVHTFIREFVSGLFTIHALDYNPLNHVTLFSEIQIMPKRKDPARQLSSLISDLRAERETRANALAKIDARLP